jgi:putative ABC transport system permease protein
MNGYIELQFTDLALAALLLAVNGLLSLRLRLGLERQLLIAAIRMVVQLTAVAFVLKALFATVSLWLTLGVAVAMILFAGREIAARQERRFTGYWSHGLGVGCMAVAAVAVVLFALTTQIQAQPWYHPRFALPLLGMVLGNTMTAVALALDGLSTLAERERAAIEAQLALGRTRTEAMRPILRRCLRSALMPTINGMAAVGLVSLPGMMTGQILAGVDPVEATKYQLLVMFLIAGGTGFGAVAAVFAAMRRLSDDRHRLRLDRLRE